LQRPTWLVLLSVASLSLLVALSPLVAPAGQPCTTCHTGENPSGNYLFKMPTLAASFPSVAPPDTYFNYTLKVGHPGKYTLKQPEAAASVEGAGRLMAGESASRELPSIGESGGSQTVTWRLTTGNATGTLFVNATLRYTARFRHTVDRSNDENPYLLRVYSTITVKPVALYTTGTDISLPAIADRSATFEIVSYSNIRNITLTASANLGGAVTLAPNFLGGLGPGQKQTVQIFVVANAAIVDNGRIDIVWENATGARDNAFVVVRTVGPAPAPEPENPVRWMGRFTGLLSLCLLISSVVLGYVKRGGPRRVRIHCAVSWFILGLSVYHGIMLVWGPYNRVWLGNWVLLGYISAALMGVSGVNGLSEGWMTKKMSYRAWIWLHRVTLISAIVLVVIHAILLGTDLRFVREAILPERLGSGKGKEEVIYLFRWLGGH